RRPWSEAVGEVGRSDGGYGVTVSQTGSGKPEKCPSASSAPKRTGPDPRIPYRPAASASPQEQAGHTEAPDYTPCPRKTSCLQRGVHTRTFPNIDDRGRLSATPTGCKRES